MKFYFVSRYIVANIVNNLGKSKCVRFMSCSVDFYILQNKKILETPLDIIK